ncbi:MAG: ATP-dependent DNA helicase RecQ [Deltaproteobacteria bacterium]|nr:ATP-dependent DNA helicase RecQ [Deltaproteobacteria bacterium]MBK8713694.1 ATP-dependent DNA helicase RecQ [Deltaproteobacteria bacterium]
MKRDPAQAVLREVFGYDDFRDGQREAVAAAIAGHDTQVLLPTGSGKSLCYQVPALVAARAGRGTTIVISPLIALMQDQVGALHGRGVSARALHSHMDDDAQREAIAALEGGELVMIYVSPERAAAPSFRRSITRTRIAMIAIDEAHCVSQWGHDFRPDYLRLHELRNALERDATAPPVLALTATATPMVMREIASRLELREPVVVRGDFSRPNLDFAVRHVGNEDARIAVLVDAIERAGVRRAGHGRAIVYCSTRVATQRVAKSLASRGIAAGWYHAGRSQGEREKAHRAFAQGRTTVLVATNAYGMGIDFPDVRLVVHHQTPGSLEAYYQEAGRAGRDGARAQCLMLFGAGDLVTQRRLTQTASASIEMQERSEQALAAIERYARQRRCRQQVLCSHFTGRDDHPTCGHCDACSDAEDDDALELPAPVVAESLGEAARATILEALGRLSRPVGKTALAQALHGSRAKSLSRGGLLSMPEYGALREHTQAEIVATIEAMLRTRVLVRRGRRFPTVWIAGRAAPSRTRAATTAQTASKTSAKATGKAGGKRASRAGTGAVARALEQYRRSVARTLSWKIYMVFARKVIVAIDRERPTTRAALAKIPGMGPAKLERFGADILALVKRHG